MPEELSADAVPAAAGEHMRPAPKIARAPAASAAAAAAADRSCSVCCTGSGEGGSSSETAPPRAAGPLLLHRSAARRDFFSFFSLRSPKARSLFEAAFNGLSLFCCREVIGLLRGIRRVVWDGGIDFGECVRRFWRCVYVVVSLKCAWFV